MVIGIFVGIILAAIAIGCALFAFYEWAENDNGLKSGVLAAVAAVAAISFFIFPFSFHTVDSGEVAVVKHLGEIREVKGPGTHFDLWVTNKYIKYDTKVRSVESTTAAYSSDAQTMDIQMTIQYQISADDAVAIATQYGDIDILQNRVVSIALDKTKAVLSGYKAMDIIENRASISPAVEAAIKEAVGEEYYVNIVSVAITNIDFSDAFELAVEEKMIAEQAKLKADYENETKVAMAEAEAEAKLKAANAEIEIAKAEAEAIKIKAEAEAEANRILEESITDKIIDKLLADAWNGELPKVVGSEEYVLPSDILGE